MKADFGVDPKFGLVHSMNTTTVKIHDTHQFEELHHGEEKHFGETKVTPTPLENAIFANKVYPLPILLGMTDKTALSLAGPGCAHKHFIIIPA